MEKDLDENILFRGEIVGRNSGIYGQVDNLAKRL